MNSPIQFPDKLQCLFQPARYKVLYGGRGGAKSWGIARALLIMGAQRPLNVLCTREMQNSMEESVHKLLSQQISALGLDGVYTIEKKHIYNALGTQFSFEGIARNVNKIRSFEGVDICWVEEGSTVSKNSWNVLIPTIRKENSEIWISFNPELETDETYQRFVLNPPISSFVVEVNWRDNPWFPQVLKDEMENLKLKDYDAYLNVWEGKCRQVLEGAIYAKELRLAQEEQRICDVPYSKDVPVDTFWDLGRRDKTAIWFAQRVAMEYRVLDYVEDSGEDVDFFLRLLEGKPYEYGTHWLPHDAAAQRMGQKSTIAAQVSSNGLRTVRIVPRLNVTIGINAARTIFPACWFDRIRCAVGLNQLRRYRYEVKDGQRSLNPKHDDASHGADAFRYLSVALRPPKKKSGLALAQHLREALRGSPHAWLGN